MALKQSQQILELIKRSRRPLICIPQGGDIDAHATAIGLARVLAKLEATPTIISADGQAPKNLHFLEGHENISPSLDQLQQFVFLEKTLSLLVFCLIRQERNKYLA